MTNENTLNPTLSKEMQHKLSYALAELFFGLARSNWTRGDQMLGTARQKALEQIDSFLASKDKSNPAVAYLHQVASTRRATWSRAIMQSARSSQVQNLPNNVKSSNAASGSKWVNAALEKLNQTIKEVGHSTPIQSKSAAFDNAAKGLQMHAPATKTPVVETVHKATLSRDQAMQLMQKKFMELIREKSKAA